MSFPGTTRCRFLAAAWAALAAGNVCVVKPAEDACLSLLRVAQLAAEAGFPAGAINIVTGYGHEVGDALARHPGIDHISFTGSPGVGTLIQQAAAERHCPVTLELGAKPANRVCRRRPGRGPARAGQRHRAERGANLQRGFSRAHRRPHLRTLLERLGQAFAQLRVGPAAMDLDVGPLIRASQQQRVWDFHPTPRWPASPWWRRVRSWTKPPKPASTRPRPCCATYPPRTAWRRKKFWPGAVRHAVRGRGPRGRTGQCHALWPGGGRVDARRRTPVSHGTARPQRPGVHQQLRRGRRVELPFGGVKSSGHGREKGLEALQGFTTLKTVAFHHG